MGALNERIENRREPLVMGVLNLTPDSFSDGGLFFDGGIRDTHVDESSAIAHAERLLADGADLIDIGAESSRPGAAPISAEEQIRRLGNVVRSLVNNGARVSIDTTLAEVARFATDQGATLINSISLDAAESLAEVARNSGAALALMHSRGSMHTMAGFSAYPSHAYGDVVADVLREWTLARDRAVERGLVRSQILFDPGLGFHKNAQQSLELCARLDEFVAHGLTVLVGPSRKSFLLGNEVPPTSRLGASVAACVTLAQKGAAMLRVHDVKEVKQALTFLGRCRAPRDGFAQAGAAG